jgi:hypothetical protein
MRRTYGLEGHAFGPQSGDNGRLDEIVERERCRHARIDRASQQRRPLSFDVAVPQVEAMNEVCLGSSVPRDIA